MLDSFNGLPIHPLAVHATVGLIPLSALMGLLYVVPRMRHWARWPLALSSVAALVATFVARESGQKLEQALKIDQNNSPVKTLVQRHAHLADQLWLIMFVYTVVAVVTALLVRPAARESRLGDDRRDVRRRDNAAASRSSGATVLSTVLPVVVLIGAVVVTIWTYRVGDAGAKAVWNPTGQVNYSVK